MGRVSARLRCDATRGQFAGYGFNKSHSAAYAWLAYQTAYLKANFPAYFMAALLTSERANTEKIYPQPVTASLGRLAVTRPRLWIDT